MPGVETIKSPMYIHILKYVCLVHNESCAFAKCCPIWYIYVKPTSFLLQTSSPAQSSPLTCDRVPTFLLFQIVTMYIYIFVYRERGERVPFPPLRTGLDERPYELQSHIAQRTVQYIYILFTGKEESASPSRRCARDLMSCRTNSARGLTIAHRSTYRTVLRCNL